MIGPSTGEPVGAHVSVQRLHDELLVTIGGELDTASAPGVLATVTARMSPTCRRIVIDAAGVAFIDAAGLRALRGGANGWPAGVEVFLRAPSPAVERMLQLVELGWLSVQPDGVSSPRDRDDADGHAGIP